MSKKVSLTPGQAKIIRDLHNAAEQAQQRLGLAFATIFADEPQPVNIEGYDAGDTDPHVLIKEEPEKA